MLGKISIFAKFVSVFLLILLSLINTNFAQNIPPDVQRILRELPPDTLQKIIEESQPKGEMTFMAVSPQQHFKMPVGLAANYQPYEKWFQSGSAVAYELDKCTANGKETIYMKNVYVLYLDEERMDSTFTTNQIARTASIKLKGLVDRWQGKCNSKELVKGESEKGGLEFDFTNNFHIRPRWFSSSKASGKIFGTELNETVQAVSKRGEPVAYSYAKSENKSSYDTRILDALRRAGYPIPNINPEQYEKDAQDYLKTKGITIDLNKAHFYGRLESERKISLSAGQSVAAIQVDFGISSGFGADMLVYRPKAMASDGDSAPVSEIVPTDDSSNKGFFQNVNYIAGENLFLANFGRNKNIVTRNQIQTNDVRLLIPHQKQDSVQAFVNLDNDDRDDAFDDTDGKVEGGDNDLIKVVLRIKINPTATAAKAQIYLDRVEFGNKVRIWRNEDKTEEFNRTDQLTPMLVDTVNFPESITNSGTGEVMLKKTLWIEGIKPSAQREILLKFKYSESGDINNPTEEEEAKITVLGIESIEWEGQKNNIYHGDDLNIPDNKDPNHRLPSDPYPIWQQATPKCQRTNSTYQDANNQTVSVSPYVPRLEPESVRVFPDRERTTTGLSGERNKVKVKVKLTAVPVEPITVHFKSFDVDDPMAAADQVDNESSAEDNRGQPKTGTFDTATVGIFAKEFTNQEEKFDFIVTTQPGDNFRIVGYGDKKFLEDLHNDDQKLNVGTRNLIALNKQRIVNASIFDETSNPRSAEIRYPDNYASKVLTVWRFFYAEVDYMDQTLKNFIEGTIKSISPDSPVSGQTTITINEGIANQYRGITDISTFSRADLTDKTGVTNTFQEGKITINGVPYPVVSSSNNSFFSDTIVITGLLPRNITSGTEFQLFDDDEAMGFTRGTDLKNLSITPNRNIQPIERDNNQAYCVAAQRYQDAYIVPDFTTLVPYNREDRVPFRRNIDSVDDKYNYSYFKFNNAEFDRKEDFWVVYVLFAYKGATYEDGDPDGLAYRMSNGNLVMQPPPNNTIPFIDELPDTKGEKAINGIADTVNGTGVYIFLEGCTERTMGNLFDFTASAIGLKDAVIHEIGHMFGAEHPDQGLMGDPPTTRFFSDISLNKIRNKKYP